MDSLAKMLLLAGLVLILAAGLVWLLGRAPGLGYLPGDIWIRRGNFTFYAPIVTSLLLSALLTIILNILFRR